MRKHVKEGGHICGVLFEGRVRGAAISVDCNPRTVLLTLSHGSGHYPKYPDAEEDEGYG